MPYQIISKTEIMNYQKEKWHETLMNIPTQGSYLMHLGMLMLYNMRQRNIWVFGIESNTSVSTIDRNEREILNDN